MEKTSDHSSKPRRPPSHAKRHFEITVESHLTKWKCKYCTMTYGEKTATSNLWRHLENKHRQNIGANDQRQSMVIRKCNSVRVDKNEWSTIDECHPSKPIKLEQHLYPFPNGHSQIPMELERNDIMDPIEYHYTPHTTWAPNPCPRISHDPEIGHTGHSMTSGHRIQDSIHRILTSRPDFLDFFNDPLVAQLMPEVHEVTVVNVVKRLVTSKERDIIGQLNKHDGGLHLIIEVVKIADRFKMVVQVAYEELGDQETSLDDKEHCVEHGSMARTRQCPLAIMDIVQETSVQEHCTRILETLDIFRVKNRLLTVTIGQGRFTNMLVPELQSMLRDIGIYSINSYATVESIRDGLLTNLQEFREHAEDIGDAASEIHDFFKALQNPKTSKASKRPRMVKMASKANNDVDQGQPNDLQLLTIRWDLMPILPHLKSVEDFLSEARALGVTYNFNCGCDWKRLNHVLQEVRSNLRNGHVGPNHEDHHRLLRTLLMKVSVFPESSERANSFLCNTNLSSPFTQPLVNAAKNIPRTMTNENVNSNLLLKMWTKFQNEDI